MIGILSKPSCAAAKGNLEDWAQNDESAAIYLAQKGNTTARSLFLA
jgi:hypothetical protein